VRQEARSGLGDDRLDRRRHAVVELDDHHVGADVADRLLEVDAAAVDGDAARLADRVGDVLRGHRAEQAPVLAGLLGDREDGAVEEVGVLLGADDRLLLGARLGLGPPLGGLDRAARGGLGELARDQVVAQVALGDVDDRPLLADALDVLEEDRLRHG
jgi:hypothetical protein